MVQEPFALEWLHAVAAARQFAAVPQVHPAYLPLPTLCNGLCHLALPRFDVACRRFCKPTALIHPIETLHLSADSKDAYLALRTEGHTQKLRLRFCAAEQPLLATAISSPLRLQLHRGPIASHMLKGSACVPSSSSRTEPLTLRHGC